MILPPRVLKMAKFIVSSSFLPPTWSHGIIAHARHKLIILVGLVKFGLAAWLGVVWPGH